MAGASRSASRAVAERLAQLAQAPGQSGFYATLRFLEAVYADRARVGEGARPSDEPVRLGQAPHLAFVAGAIDSFTVGDGSAAPHRLASYFFGLFGPNGPLPLHLTEYAYDREQQFDDRTFRAFADMFHHRLYAMFYRAWANAQPTARMDRPDGRTFDRYVGALFGLGDRSLFDRDHIDDDAKRFWAGRLSAPAKSAEGLRALLKHYFAVPVRIEQFVGEWLDLRESDWLRLGGRRRGAVLGLDAIVGSQVWTTQHRIRIHCGPLDFSQFTAFLPEGASLAQLKDLVRLYLGDELAWDCQLALKAPEVPSVRLGQFGQLGWSSWLGERDSTQPATDVVVDPFFKTNNSS
ncbi:MAG: type VI secretion system baseplate subunit TssG [Pseudomonadota bacterium]